MIKKFKIISALKISLMIVGRWHFFPEIFQISEILEISKISEQISENFENFHDISEFVSEKYDAISFKA